jgi:hypothetical protein
MGWTTKELSFNSWKGQKIFSSAKHSDHLWGPPSLPRIVSRGKVADCKADHSYASSAGIKNGCNCTSIPPYAFMTCTWTILPLPYILTYDGLIVKGFLTRCNRRGGSKRDREGGRRRNAYIICNIGIHSLFLFCV